MTWPAWPGAALSDVVPFVVVVLLGLVPSRYEPSSSFFANQRWGYRGIVIVMGVITTLNLVPLPRGAFTSGWPRWAIAPVSVAVILIASVWAVVRWSQRRPWRALGFEPSTALYHWLWAMRIALGIASALAVLTFVARSLAPGGPPPSTLSPEPLPLAWTDLVAWYSLVAVFGPFAEELIFRGLAYGPLFRKFGAAGAAVVTAVFWAASHSLTLSYFSVIRSIFVLIVGIIYAEIYRRRESLVPTVTFHIVGNSASVLLRDPSLFGRLPAVGAWVGLWVLSVVLFRIARRSATGPRDLASP